MYAWEIIPSLLPLYKVSTWLHANWEVFKYTAYIYDRQQAVS